MARTYYPTKKIIVWAANAHIQAQSILSSYLSDSIKVQCYRIGIFNAEKMKIGKVIKDDAIFVDFSNLKNLKNPVYYRYKDQFDAAIFLKKTSQSIVLK